MAKLKPESGDDTPAYWRQRVRELEAELQAARIASGDVSDPPSADEIFKDAILEASLDAIVSIDQDSRVLEWSPAAERIFGYPRAEALGRDLDALIIPPELREHHRRGMRHYLATGEGPVLGRRVEVEAINRSGGRLPIELAISSTRVQGSSQFTAFLRDISDRRMWLEHQRLLVNELNHRVKNTLATVQSIASQTLRAASDAAGARHDLEERLGALARAHDVLTRESWERADLGMIVEQALQPYRPAERHRIGVDGPQVWLEPRHALALAMAFQELATNAVKYGALSVEPGRLQVGWRLDGEAGGQRLTVTWIEAGVDGVAAPSRAGFGTRLLQHSLARELGGRVDLDFRPGGLACTIRAPLG